MSTSKFEAVTNGSSFTYIEDVNDSEQVNFAHGTQKTFKCSYKTKVRKHLIDSFLGAPAIRQPRKSLTKLSNQSDIVKYQNPIAKQESKIAEPKFGRGKRIKVWINGDAHCYEFNINPKDFRSWTSILLHITNSVKPIFGAVRKLVALSSLKSIDCFDDLDPNERYVALGTTCKFKMAPGGYRTSSEKELYKREKVTKRFYSGEMNAKVMPFLLETEKKKLTIIYMTVNGRSNQPPQKLVLNYNDMKDWALIFNFLTKILDMPDGIACICTIFGDILKEPSELQHGYLYVAVPFKEHFIHMDYMSVLGEHQSKYRSSYTVTIRPAPTPPDKLFNAIRKMKKKKSTADYYYTDKYQRRPCTPVLDNRSSKMLVKQINPSRELKSITQTEMLSRCDSQPVKPIMIHQDLPTRCDSQPTGPIVIKEVLDDDENDFGYLTHNVTTICKSQVKTVEDSPTYTVVSVPTRRPISPSGMMARCNLVQVIKDNIVAVDSEDYFTKNPSQEIGLGKECVNDDIDGNCIDDTSQLEVPAVQQSTVVIRNLNHPSPRDGTSPTIHIRNRTDISIYNIKAGNNKCQSSESCCNIDRIKMKGLKYEYLNKKNEAVAQLKHHNNNEKFDNTLTSNWRGRGGEGRIQQMVEAATSSDLNGSFLLPKYGSKQKSRTFTLNSNMRERCTPPKFVSTLKDKNEEISDIDFYPTLSEEETSLSSNDVKHIHFGKGDLPPDREYCNLHFKKQNRPVASEQCESNHTIKENNREVREVKKSIQQRIGIGSFRVSTPEVEGCLRYSLGDGKYMQEDISCSISSDSIEIT